MTGPPDRGPLDTAADVLTVAARRSLVHFRCRCVWGGDTWYAAFRTDPLANVAVVSAKNIVLDGNVEVKGTLDTVNTTILTVRTRIHHRRCRCAQWRRGLNAPPVKADHWGHRGVRVRPREHPADLETAA
jgi:hypothetical protein